MAGRQQACERRDGRPSPGSNRTKEGRRHWQTGCQATRAPGPREAQAQSAFARLEDTCGRPGPADTAIETIERGLAEAWGRGLTVPHPSGRRVTRTRPT
jgi:hypothetical protein